MTDVDKMEGGRAPQAPVLQRSRAWLLEMPLFFAGLIALQHFSFPQDPAFLSIQPSPLWIGVLLFGLRYGLLAGVATGAAAALLHAWGMQRLGEGYRLEDADFYLRPGLYLMVGAGLGIAADNSARRIADLNGRVRELLESLTGMQKQVSAEQKVLRSVEQQVVSQMSSVVTLFHGSKELGTLEREALFPAMLAFFTAALQAQKASLYAPKDGKWILLSASGWAEDDAYPRSVEQGQGVIGRAAAEGRVVTVKDLPRGEGGSPGADAVVDAVMAAPIYDPNGAPVAVFAVQTMDFLNFNSASVNLLALLSEWGSESLANCLRVEDLKSYSLFDEKYMVQSARYFEKQLAQEFERSVRYALPYSIFLVEIEGERDFPRAKREATRRVVGRVLRESVRSSDDVARSPLGEFPFAVLLNTSTRERAEQERERMLAAFAVLGMETTVKIGVGSYRSEMKGKEEIVEEARSQFL